MSERFSDRTMRGGSTPEFFADAWAHGAPWDTGRPQRAVLAAVDEGLVRGAVIDLGCGSGEHALLCAARGHEAWGVDVVPEAIAIARRKAVERGLEATFVVGDALEPLGRTFDTAIDVGLFHALSDPDRVRYAATLRATLCPGGALLLLCFSDAQPGEGFPRRVSEPELRASFADGFTFAALRPARYETVAPGAGDWPGAHAWLAVLRREA